MREKHDSPRDFYEAAETAIVIARQRGARIIINDRVDISLVLRADGVHLGQDDLPPEHAREILGPGAIIGFSTHSVEQAVAAALLPIDYIAIGQIFASDTKDNADPVVGLEGLHDVREAIGDFPLAAIGGITLANLADVFDAGADSAAIIAALISEPETISTKTTEFMSLKSSK